MPSFVYQVNGGRSAGRDLAGRMSSPVKLTEGFSQFLELLSDLFYENQRIAFVGPGVRGRW
jgi:hypothetical protein